MKSKITLTESELHNFIKESVEKILTELDWRTYASAYQKARDNVKNSSDDIMNIKNREQSRNFKKAASDTIEKQYGFKFGKDDINAKKINDFYDEHGYDNDELEKPSRRALKGMSDYRKDKNAFYYGKGHYDKEDGKWKNESILKDIINKEINEALNK